MQVRPTITRGAAVVARGLFPRPLLVGALGEGDPFLQRYSPAPSPHSGPGCTRSFFSRNFKLETQKRWNAVASASSEAAVVKSEDASGVMSWVVDGKEVLLSTTPTVPGHSVSQFKGLVEGTAVRGRSALDIWKQQLQQQLGGEQRLLSDLLRETRRAALERLAASAVASGANAVVGVRLVTSGLQRMHVEYTAYGTAVRISKS